MSANTVQLSRSGSCVSPFTKKKVTSFVINLSIVLLSALMLFPLFWIIITSFKGQLDVLKNPLGVIPQKFMLFENFTEVLKRAPWVTFYKNTIIVAVGTLAAQLCVSVPAAYALAYFNFRFKGLVYIIVLARLLISPESLLLPNYLTINGLNLYNTLLGISLPSIASAISLLMFRTAFLEIPSALKDSADIDGCTDLRYLFSIAIPSIKSRIVAFSITSLVYQWNSYFWPMVITESVNKRTLAVGLAYFGLQAESASEWGLTMTAALLVILPLLVVLVFFQKQLVDSFVTSGIK